MISFGSLHCCGANSTELHELEFQAAVASKDTVTALSNSFTAACWPRLHDESAYSVRPYSWPVPSFTASVPNKPSTEPSTPPPYLHEADEHRGLLLPLCCTSSWPFSARLEKKYSVWGGGQSEQADRLILQLGIRQKKSQSLACGGFVAPCHCPQPFRHKPPTACQRHPQNF